MYDILKGMKIIELSAFIAAPLAGLSLAQLGAEVIRIDPAGGGLDYRRWPLSEDGTSLYWTGLNKGKRSVALDLRSEDGRDTFKNLLANSGPDGGILLTNLTGPKWLDYEALKAVRSDLIMVSLSGHHDGATAVDYTVNSAVGFPFATGHATPDTPVNHVLPAWDAIAGLTMASGILAAERHRNQTGEGQEIKLALSDVAYGLTSHLGFMAEAETQGKNRPALGNHLYGTWGHNLPTRDGRQIMIIALTKRHWASLLDISVTADAMSKIEDKTGHDLSTDEGRYAARDEILNVLAAWSKKLSLGELSDILNQAKIVWGPYQTFTQMVEEDPRASLTNPMFQQIRQDGVGDIRSAGSALNFVGKERLEIRPAQKVGADTEAVLNEWLS